MCLKNLDQWYLLSSSMVIPNPNAWNCGWCNTAFCVKFVTVWRCQNSPWKGRYKIPDNNMVLLLYSYKITPDFWNGSITSPKFANFLRKGQNLWNTYFFYISMNDFNGLVTWAAKLERKQGKTKEDISVVDEEQWRAYVCFNNQVWTPSTSYSSQHILLSIECAWWKYLLK